MARFVFDSRNPPDDIRRRLLRLDRQSAAADQAAGDFLPAMDVLESDAGVELVLDLPGVLLETVAVTYLGGVVTVAGVKRPTQCEHRQAAFHLAERCFGRFTRSVRVSGAYDPRQATATLVAGELRILLPRLADRRGQEIRIRIERAGASTARQDP